MLAPPACGAKPVRCRIWVQGVAVVARQKALHGAFVIARSGTPLRFRNGAHPPGDDDREVCEPHTIARTSADILLEAPRGPCTIRPATIATVRVNGLQGRNRWLDRL